MLPQSQSAPALPRLRIVEPYEIAPPIDFVAAKRQRHFAQVASLYEQYRKGLAIFVMQRYELDNHAADDAVHNAFLFLLERVDIEIRNPRALVFLLCRQAAHRMLLACYQRKAKTRLFIDFKGKKKRWGPAVASNGQTAVENTAHRELVDRVNAHLAQVRSPAVRERLVQRIFEGVVRGESSPNGQAVADQMRALRRKLADVRPSNKPIRLVKTNDSNNRRFYDVWCVDPERKFNNTQEAADFAGVARSTIKSALQRKSNAGGYRFEWRLRPEGPKPFNMTPARAAHIYGR